MRILALIVCVVASIAAGCGGSVQDDLHNDTAFEGKTMADRIKQELPEQARTAWEVSVAVQEVGCVFDGDKTKTTHTYSCTVQLTIDGEPTTMFASAACDGEMCSWRSSYP